MAVRAPRSPSAFRSALAGALLAAAFAAAGALPAPAAARLIEGFHPAGRSMWIWYVDRSDGGNVAAIIARARAADVRTLIVKAADGANLWSQFNPALVRELHAAGLHVCAWQYVYGGDPAGEAALGERAALAGADCLVIDAEAEYEGRYAAAQTYMGDLRAVLGRHYAIGLASFPYVDYHPAFPYSVFLGRGAANFSLPQMYWQDIGTSVDAVFAHTYEANRIYGRPIYPTGQTYGAPDPAGVLRFREITEAYGAPGPDVVGLRLDERVRPVGQHRATAVRASRLRRPQRRAAAARARRPGRPGAVAAGASRRRRARTARDRPVRRRDGGEPARLPGRPPPAGQRRDRCRHVARAAGPAPGRDRVDRQREPGEHTGGSRPISRERGRRGRPPRRRGECRPRDPARPGPAALRLAARARLRGARNRRRAPRPLRPARELPGPRAAVASGLTRA